MKVANNMDSVFADCTKDELDFELMFDDDDCLIDIVAGVDEAGNLVTGVNPEDTYEFQLDEDGNDPLTDKCDIGRREGAVKDAGEAPEGSEKNQDKDFETVEGMEKEVPGAGNSEESKADEVTPEIKDAIGEDASEGPIEDKDDTARREGDVKDASSNVEGEKQEVIDAAQEGTETKEETCSGCGKPVSECTCSVSESIIARIRAKRKAVSEEVDTSKETDDTFEKEINAEGGEKSEGPLEDKDDDARREGEVKDASSNVEGEKQEVIGATQEASEEDIDKQLSDPETVPDSIQTDGSANNIAPDAETQSSDGVEPATEDVVYKWDKVTESDTVDNADDGDIEMVNNGDFEDDSELELDVDYDDDALIDIAINGGDLD